MYLIYKIRGKNDLCPKLTHGFQVLYLRYPLKILWYINIFPITKMDKVGAKTFTTYQFVILMAVPVFKS